MPLVNQQHDVRSIPPNVGYVPYPHGDSGSSLQLWDYAGRSVPTLKISRFASRTRGSRNVSCRDLSYSPF